MSSLINDHGFRNNLHNLFCIPWKVFIVSGSNVLIEMATKSLFDYHSFVWKHTHWYIYTHYTTEDQG